MSPYQRTRLCLCVMMLSIKQWNYQAFSPKLLVLTDNFQQYKTPFNVLEYDIHCESKSYQLELLGKLAPQHGIKFSPKLLVPKDNSQQYKTLFNVLDFVDWLGSY